MASTFGTYNVAYAGMYVSQAALTATSNNLANVSTTGASRVRVTTTDQSVSQADGTAVNSGASVASITRARDRLLDATYRSQSADASYWAVKSGDLEYMEEILSEFTASDGTSSDGLQELMNDFFTSWEELAKDTSSESSRQAVIESSASLISGLAEIDSQLQQLQEDAVSGAADGVDSLNELAAQVAELNGQITVAEVGGEEASYLRDQRDALIDQMASLASISVTESNGVLKVTIGGSTLVDGIAARTLTTEGTGTASDPLTVRWEDSGNVASISSGSIKAYLEDADQTGYGSIDTTSLPYNFSASAASSISNLRQALNALVTTIAAETNSLHTSGCDLDGNAGLDFFTAVDASQSLSIANIQVNPVVASDPDKVVTAAAGADDGDNSIADAICALSDEDILEFDGLGMSANEFYQQIVSWIGTAGSNAASSYETQSSLVSQVDSQRQSVLSISMDDEMSNLVIFQNAYNANARVLSTIDGLIGDLIDDLG